MSVTERSGQEALQVKYDAAFQKGEAWLAAQVWIRTIFPGQSTPESRREIFRAEILRTGIADHLTGKRAGKAITIREAFEALYGQPL